MYREKGFFCVVVCAFLSAALLLITGCSSAGGDKDGDDVTIVFHAQGGYFHGKNGAAEVDVRVGVRTAITAPKVFHEEDSPDTSWWRFGGWSTTGLAEDVGAAEEVLSHGVASGTSLYAVWEQVPLADTSKVEADWLYLAYMDADNNLQPEIWADLNEMEAGLAVAPAGVTIKVFVLWDGRSDDVEGVYVGSAATKLYELGPDGNMSDLGVNTKEIAKDPRFFEDPDRDELNMSQAATLTAFLRQARSRYSASRSVLGFSNHGAGPRSVRSLFSANRAMLQDETSGPGSLMRSRVVGQAIAAAGFNTVDDKLDLMVLDVCLGSSVEDTCEFGVYADYVLAAPNLVPADGMDYRHLFGSISKTTTVEDFGVYAVKDYKLRYSKPKGSLCALTFYSTKGAFALKDAVNELADLILTEDRTGGLHDGYGARLRSSLLNNSLEYEATYVILADLGYMAEQIVDFEREKTEWPELALAAERVADTIKADVLYAWRGNGIKSYAGAALARGITIAWRGYSSWYGTDLQFGKDSKWGDLLRDWF